MPETVSPETAIANGKRLLERIREIEKDMEYVAPEHREMRRWQAFAEMIEDESKNYARQKEEYA
jgi:hypothetical protein